MTLHILVPGCGDVGSSVAHRLFLQGADVVRADVEAPPHPRRGMAFADAWFDSTATLIFGSNNRAVVVGSVPGGCRSTSWFS